MSEQQDCDDVVKALYADWLQKHQNLQWIVDVDTALGKALEQCFRDAYAMGYLTPTVKKSCPECGEEMVKFGANWRCTRGCKTTWVRAVPVAKTQKPMITEEEYRTDGF